MSSKKGGFNNTTISDTISSFQLLSNRDHLLQLPINGHTQNVFNSNFAGGKKTIKSTVKKTVKPTVKPSVKKLVKH